MSSGDVDEGLVSDDVARTIYGVVRDGEGRIEEQQTNALRHALRVERLKPGSDDELALVWDHNGMIRGTADRRLLCSCGLETRFTGWQLEAPSTHPARRCPSAWAASGAAERTGGTRACLPTLRDPAGIGDRAHRRSRPAYRRADVADSGTGPPRASTARPWLRAAEKIRRRTRRRDLDPLRPAQRVQVVQSTTGHPETSSADPLGAGVVDRRPALLSRGSPRSVHSDGGTSTPNTPPDGV